jgi:hypothetical protein
MERLISRDKEGNDDQPFFDEICSSSLPQAVQGGADNKLEKEISSSSRL